MYLFSHRAEVLALELLLHDLAGVLHLVGDDVLAAVEAEHEVRALVEVDAEHLRDVRLRLRLVVEAHRARAEARAHERGAGLHRRVEVLEDVGAKLAGLGLWVDLQCHLGDHAERTLTAEEEHREVGTGRVARHGERTDDLARRRNHLKRHHHVLNLAILRGKDTRAAMREESADRCAGDGSG